MPVIGHAFVGWATGICTEPPRSLGRGASGRVADRTLWVPLAIGLAYVPDAVGQIGLLGGLLAAPLVGHSVWIAIALAPVLGSLLALLTGASFRRSGLVAGTSLVLHDLLDVMQSANRQPWWPFSGARLVLGRPLLPASTGAEALLFGGAFVVFALLRHGSRRRGLPPIEPPKDPAPASWSPRVLLFLLMTAAVSTHHLRGVREAELAGARAAVAEGQYDRALDLAERAARWPSTAKPGRIQHVLGEAHEGRGERAQAERYYLRACEEDPTYFWSLADLAVLYASGQETSFERRRRLAPYLERLRSEFANEPELPQVLARIERKLASVDELDKSVMGVGN